MGQQRTNMLCKLLLLAGLVRLGELVQTEDAVVPEIPESLVQTRASFVDHLADKVGNKLVDLLQEGGCSTITGSMTPAQCISCGWKYTTAEGCTKDSVVEHGPSTWGLLQDQTNKGCSTITGSMTPAQCISCGWKYTTAEGCTK